ncbi:TlpA family protein disulfide reductase [Burkholderiaceae bacterium DAT-1]|nr:TlpA family protein disulfide reductase [Burkholderiaceae bacterium DAT-1]
MKSRFAVGLGVAGALLGAALIFTGAKATPAPQVSYTSIQGEQITQASLKGKVVLVNFWATTCTGCVAEMPKLMATQNKFAERGLKTVAVAMSYDPPTQVAAFAEARKLPFFVALDGDGKLAKQFGDVNLTPTTFLIDKHGNIVQRYIGEPDFAKLEQLITDKLAEA